MEGIYSTGLYLARAGISARGNFLCVSGPNPPLEVMRDIWAGAGVHGTVVLSEVFLCMERSKIKRSPLELCSRSGLDLTGRLC